MGAYLFLAKQAPLRFYAMDRGTKMRVLRIEAIAIALVAVSLGACASTTPSTSATTEAAPTGLSNPAPLSGVLAPVESFVIRIWSKL